MENATGRMMVTIRQHVGTLKRERNGSTILCENRLHLRSGEVHYFGERLIMRYKEEDICVLPLLDFPQECFVTERDLRD